MAVIDSAGHRRTTNGQIRDACNEGMDKDRDTSDNSDTRNARGAVAQTEAGVSRADGGSSAAAVCAVRDAAFDRASERSVDERLSAGRDVSGDGERWLDARGEG